MEPPLLWLSKTRVSFRSCKLMQESWNSQSGLSPSSNWAPPWRGLSVHSSHKPTEHVSQPQKAAACRKGLSFYLVPAFFLSPRGLGWKGTVPPLQRIWRRWNLGQQFSKCGPQARVIRISWTGGRNPDPQHPKLLSWPCGRGQSMRNPENPCTRCATVFIIPNFSGNSLSPRRSKLRLDKTTASITLLAKLGGRT